MILIADKLVGHIVPVRFAPFVFVGGIGLILAQRISVECATEAGCAGRE